MLVFQSIEEQSNELQGVKVGGHVQKGGKEDIFTGKGGQKEDIF